MLDSLDESDLSSFDEADILELFYEFTTEEEHYLTKENASSKFLKWFNETKLEPYICEKITDDEYNQLEKIW